MNTTSILLVEDDGILAAHLYDYLRESDYEMLPPVATGLKAISVALESQPSLVLMDIELTGDMDGIEAATKIWELAHIPVVFLTSYSQNVLIEKAKSAHPYGYLVKPVNERELVATIEMAIARHAAERAVRESEERYRLIFENSGDGIILSSETGEISSANLAAQHMLQRSEAEIISLGRSGVVHPGDPHLRQMMDEAYKKGKSVGEVAHLRKDGTTFPVYVTVTHFTDSEGKLQAVVLLRDLTAQKEAEKKIMELNSDFLIFLENTSDFVYFKDKDSRIRFCSKTLADITGHSSWRDMIGKHDAEIFPEDVAAIYMEEELPIFKEGKPLLNKINPYYDTSGAKGWVSTNKFPVFDADGKTVVGIFGVSRDITEQKLIEEKISILSKAVEQSPVSIVITDLDGAIQYVNNKFTEITGYSFEEAIHQNPRILKSGEQPREYYEEMYQTLLAGNEWNGVFHNKKKNGELYWESSVITPMMDINGNIYSFLAVKKDISARKEAEMQLTIANERLQKLNAEKDKFFSIIAHDLRSPFSGFLGLTKIMAEDLLSMPITEIMELSQIMQESANTMYKLLENLLEWSRMQRGTASFLPDMYELRSLAEQNIKLLATNFEKKKIEVHNDIAHDLSVWCDVPMLNSVLRNILSNAVKFTNTGGEIWLTSEENDQEVLLAVRDSGIGIDEETISKLFRLDEIVSRPGTAGEPSTGLGLLLCKEFIERHGGRIWVKSQVGMGTTFYCSLPKRSPIINVFESEESGNGVL